MAWKMRVLTVLPDTTRSTPPSSRIILLLGIVLLCSLPGTAQDLQGRVYPEKNSYMVGEPVLFNVEIKNTGTEAIYVNAKNPEGCLDSFDFSVTGANSSCGAKWDLECQANQSPLLPGDSLRAQWPLDLWYQFERDGKFEVNATRHIPIRSIHGNVQDFIFSSKFEVNLEPPDPARVQSILQEFERNLNSSDPEVRHDALDVLASTSPPYFQGIALRLSRGEDAFAALHAVGALERLNTPETRAALADIVSATGEVESQDRIQARANAIEALGHSGDASYLNLVERYIGDKNDQIQSFAMVASALLGKAEVVPQLQRFLLNADPAARKNAGYALRFSTTPEAVEVLINAVVDKDADVREQVLTSLKELTGHSVGATMGDGASPEKIQNGWRSWWKTNKDKLVFPERLEFLCHMK